MNSQIEQQVNKHKTRVQFQPEDLERIHMRKERFPSKRKSKIMPRSEGPFEILEQVCPNAYKVDLPEDYGISSTFNVADLRPYVDESEEIPSLRSNPSQLRGDDGDHPIQPVEDQVTAQSHVQRSSIAKEAQLLARNALDLTDSEDCSSSGNRPGFVWLVELDPGEVISCTHASLKAQDLSFPTSPHTPQLEFICSVKRRRNCKCVLPGVNPVKGRSRAHLDNQINSNFCKTLGHKK